MRSVHANGKLREMRMPSLSSLGELAHRWTTVKWARTTGCLSGRRLFSNDDKSRTRLTNLPSGSAFSIRWDDHTSRLRLRRRGTLSWHGQPRTVLLVKKWRDQRATHKAREMVNWLVDRGLSVMVEDHDIDCYPPQQVKRWCNDSSPIDFCITLGGDGTLLHLSRLLESRTADSSECLPPPGQIPSLPPCISFGMGTLGFLTNHNVEDFEQGDLS